VHLRWSITFSSKPGSVKWTSNFDVSKVCAGPAAGSAGAEDMHAYVAWLLGAIAAAGTHKSLFNCRMVVRAHPYNGPSHRSQHVQN